MSHHSLKKKLIETWIIIYTTDHAIFVLKNGNIWQHCWFTVLKTLSDIAIGWTNILLFQNCNKTLLQYTSQDLISQTPEKAPVKNSLMCSNIAAADKGRNPTDTAYLITDWIIFKNHRHETVRFPLFLECISLLLPCFTADCLLFLISKHLHSYQLWILLSQLFNWITFQGKLQQSPGFTVNKFLEWATVKIRATHKPDAVRNYQLSIPSQNQAHCWQKMQDMFTWQNFYLRVLSLLSLRWVNFRVLSITYDKTSISFKWGRCTHRPPKKYMQVKLP